MINQNFIQIRNYNELVISNKCLFITSKDNLLSQLKLMTQFFLKCHRNIYALFFLRYYNRQNQNDFEKKMNYDLKIGFSTFETSV